MTRSHLLLLVIEHVFRGRGELGSREGERREGPFSGGLVGRSRREGRKSIYLGDTRWADQGKKSLEGEKKRGAHCRGNVGHAGKALCRAPVENLGFLRRRLKYAGFSIRRRKGRGFLST